MPAPATAPPALRAQARSGLTRVGEHAHPKVTLTALARTCQRAARAERVSRSAPTGASGRALQAAFAVGERSRGAARRRRGRQGVHPQRRHRAGGPGEAARGDLRRMHASRRRRPPGACTWPARSCALSERPAAVERRPTPSSVKWSVPVAPVPVMTKLPGIGAQPAVVGPGARRRPPSPTASDAIQRNAWPVATATWTSFAAPPRATASPPCSARRRVA